MVEVRKRRGIGLQYKRKLLHWTAEFGIHKFEYSSSVGELTRWSLHEEISTNAPSPGQGCSTRTEWNSSHFVETPQYLFRGQNYHRGWLAEWLYMKIPGQNCRRYSGRLPIRNLWLLCETITVYLWSLITEVRESTVGSRVALSWHSSMITR